MQPPAADPAEPVAFMATHEQWVNAQAELKRLHRQVEFLHAQVAGHESAWAELAAAARNQEPQAIHARLQAFANRAPALSLQVLTPEAAALVNAAIGAAQTFMWAELASSSHGSTCPVCRREDGHTCDKSDELWGAEIHARTSFWTALEPALAAVGKGGTYVR